MTDYIDVVEHNPIVFVKAIAEAIEQGYNVKNTIAGYPQFGSYGNQVRLFKGDRVGSQIVADGHSGMVEHYEPMAFILMVETFVLAGYKFKDNGRHYFDEKGLKSVEMELIKEEPVVKDKTPAKKAPAKKALQAEPTKTELEAE